MQISVIRAYHIKSIHQTLYSTKLNHGLKIHHGSFHNYETYQRKRLNLTNTAKFLLILLLLYLMFVNFTLLNLK